MEKKLAREWMVNITHGASAKWVWSIHSMIIGQVEPTVEIDLHCKPAVKCSTCQGQTSSGPCFCNKKVQSVLMGPTGRIGGSQPVLYVWAQPSLCRLNVQRSQAILVPLYPRCRPSMRGMGGGGGGMARKDLDPSSDGFN